MQITKNEPIFSDCLTNDVTQILSQIIMEDYVRWL